jgi:hypothetical protein
VKRSEHICAAEGCANACPRDYPFCYSCWMGVPPEMRKSVRAALAARGTAELDRSDLYRAVSEAIAFLRVSNSPAIKAWDAIYTAAGRPEI